MNCFNIKVHIVLILDCFNPFIATAIPCRTICIFFFGARNVGKGTNNCMPLKKVEQ